MRKIEILQKLVGAEHLEAIKAFTALLENDLQEYEISFNKIGEIQNEFSQIVGAKIYQSFVQELENKLAEEQCSSYYIDEATYELNIKKLLDCAIKSYHSSIELIDELSASLYDNYFYLHLNSLSI